MSHNVAFTGWNAVRVFPGGRWLAMVSVAAAMVLAGGGCRSSGVIGHASASRNLGMPAPGKAKVVFFRSSTMGSAVVFNVHDGEKLAAVLPYKSLGVYECDPGRHMFSSTMGSVSVLDAELLPDRIYYVMVSAGSTFRALHPDRPDRYWARMPAWLPQLRETVVSPEASARDRQNIANYMERVEKYHREKYLTDPERERILPAYGQAMPVRLR